MVASAAIQISQPWEFVPAITVSELKIVNKFQIITSRCVNLNLSNATIIDCINN